MSLETPARYVAGFDLGTTNSAVCYVDTSESPWRVRTFPVPQLVAPGQVESREGLPSFHYQPASGELAPGALRLPFGKEEPNYAVGVFARDHGSMVPGRLIASAKSWLCHSGVDRTAPLLPWHGAPDVDRLSPVEASARYMAHVRDAWGARFPGFPLAEQDFVLTLPASFDEIARELTVKAAARAGLPRVVLIEEPQAAFYAWIDKHSADWQQHVSPGQKILVCDIGGGTSDFTLIRVHGEASSKVRFHRVAVGEHLILGGDNMDLALAHHLERRLAGDGKLDPRAWTILLRSCRAVKETFFGDNPPERLTVSVPGAGSRLIGGAIQAEVARGEVEELLVEGFFPKVRLEDRPATRRSGFQEFGLPYAPDAAITRYLAAFLTAHRHVAIDGEVPADHDPARPDIVLFNGGVFNSPALRQRLLEVLTSWFRTDPASAGWEPLVLDNERLDLAVAHGAAYYGMVRRGQGERIAAGLARTYYIGVESEPPAALCLVPAGVEPGHDVDLTDREETGTGTSPDAVSVKASCVCSEPVPVSSQPRFDLLVSQPVEFPLYVSSTRLTDRPGDLVAVDREQMTPLPPIRTVLRTRKKGEADRLSVNLHARLTEIGTLDLWCTEVGGRGSWRLQFDVRSATETDVEAHESAAEREGFFDEATWQEFDAVLRGTFGPDASDDPAPLIKRLSQAGGMNRNLWPTSLLRRIWELLMELEPGRRRGQAHEARWLGLLGFALRPGYGLAVDDWRVAETWRVLQGNLIHPTPACRAEWWILWRRIAGGLTPGQQQALADPILGVIRGLHRQMTTGKGRSEFNVGSHETAEIWRMLGSFELLAATSKIELGGILLDLLPKRKMEPVRSAALWALGRLGARLPVYGPLNTVVPIDTAGQWVARLMELDLEDPMADFAVMQMARRTGDRYRDLADKLRQQVLAWLEGRKAPAHFVELVREAGRLETEEQGLVFGESLPKGLRIL